MLWYENADSFTTFWCSSLTPLALSTNSGTYSDTATSLQLSNISGSAGKGFSDYYRMAPVYIKFMLEVTGAASALRYHMNVDSSSRYVSGGTILASSTRGKNKDAVFGTSFMGQIVTSAVTSAVRRHAFGVLHTGTPAGGDEITIDFTGRMTAGIFGTKFVSVTAPVFIDPGECLYLGTNWKNAGASPTYLVEFVVANLRGKPVT